MRLLALLFEVMSQTFKFNLSTSEITFYKLRKKFNDLNQWESDNRDKLATVVNLCTADDFRPICDGSQICTLGLIKKRGITAVPNE